MKKIIKLWLVGVLLSAILIIPENIRTLKKKYFQYKRREFIRQKEQQIEQLKEEIVEKLRESPDLITVCFHDFMNLVSKKK